MNEAVILFLCLVSATLAFTVVFLSYRLASAGSKSQQWADKCMEHACAFNEDQRTYMRDKMEFDKSGTVPDKRPYEGQTRPKPYQPIHPADVVVMPELTPEQAYQG